MKTVPADGLWLDKNEPNNRCNGGCFNEKFSFRHETESDFNLFNPPYNINNQDKMYSLNYKTLDVFTKQYGGHVFFDTHNLYSNVLNKLDSCTIALCNTQ